MQILIAIHGSHDTTARMNAQRETWIRRFFSSGSYSLHGIEAHYRYFVGRPQGSDPDAEYVDFDDAPVWITEGPVSRRTAVLNIRTRALVRYALERKYDYLFKCDDDTYIRPHLLLSSGFESYEYSGQCERHHADDIGWYKYAGGGGGYWLSRKAMIAVIESRICHCAEDCNAGQVLARAGIRPQEDDRYRNAVSDHDRRHPSSEWITLHKCDPEQIRIVHHALFPFPSCQPAGKM